jgi:hypothetical protein
VVEGRDGPGLALEAVEPPRVGRVLGRQQLEGHVASELGVPGAIDLAHAAGADLVEDAVVGEVEPIIVLPAIPRRARRSTR